MQIRKLKRGIIKEELVVVTANFVQAILLQQFIYWSARTKDSDRYILEEKQRLLHEGEKIELPRSHGWIYKKAEDLADETMLQLNEKTIRTHLKMLISKRYIEQRRNPIHKWDRTYQYRVNLVKIIQDLNREGFHLEGYEMLSRNDDFSASNDNDSGAIPEITKEITTETTTTSFSKKEENHLVVNDSSFKKVSKLFLQLSSRKKLMAKDRLAIQEVLQLGFSLEQILDWTKLCFTNFKSNQNGDCIWSFQYVANYIHQQEVLSNGQITDNTSKTASEDDPIYNKIKEQYGSDGGWTGATECDF